MSDKADREGIRRELDTDVDDPTAEVIAALADIEDKDTTNFTNLWGCTDDVLRHLFDNPPSPEADMRIGFNFEGYRITVHQDGYAEFRKHA